MLRGLMYRIYPDVEQETLCGKHFGCTRLIFNLGLETKQAAYAGNKINLSRNDLSAQLTDLKKEFKFLNEVNAQSLQAPLKHLDTAYQNFFKGLSCFPKFKSRVDEQKFHCPQNVEIRNGRIWLPKFKTGIRINIHRKFNGKIKNVVITKTASGKYFASILIDDGKEVPAKKPVDKSTAVGIDRNIGDTIVCSDGEKTPNPKYLVKSISKLKFLQKTFSRMKKGSKRRERMRLRIARLHEKIANQRKDFLHKLSYAITKRYDTTCMETLSISNMMKNHKLARAIGDSGWGMLGTFIKYKADWNGKNVLFIDRFAPSTKTCSCCDHINHDLSLNDRKWACPSCGVRHDRDVNAAINILRFALNKHFGVAVRTRQDAEESPLSVRKKRAAKRAVEALKVLNVVLPCASQSFSEALPL